MRDSTVIAELERRLAEFGFRDARLRLRARELREHHEDLKQAALEEGMSETDAEARAEKLLGEPYALAAQISAVLRQSSWYGRHPVITFCLLPLVGMLLMMALGLGVDALATRLCFRAGEVSLLAETGAGMALLNTVVLGTWCGMVLLTAIFFCWLAQRTARGLIWALTACAVCSFYSCCAGIQLHPHQVTLCCGFPPALFHPDWVPLNWMPLLAPMLVAAGVWWRRHQRLKRFPVPVRAAGGIRAPRPRVVLAQTGFFTPSGLIAILAVGAIVVAGLRVRSEVLRQAAIHRERIATIWPAERAAVERQLKSRQMTVALPDARTINLKPWLNAALTDSLGGWDDASSNNLAELPQGLHVFDGIPFDVEGRLQLMGRNLLDGDTTWPVRVRNIKVAAKCVRIHLLHGANGITEDMTGRNVATLVLHYSDGSQVRIPIVAGSQVRDWWGPIYDTAAGWNSCQPTAPGSELAWIGSNPRIKEKEPELSLRLYQSTFENPRPDLEIASIDFVSSVTDAAPFFVGLTLE
ncbi:MAG TPA: hypothetical protein VN048_10845 [Verrucomicrobiae bacterium]|jgi:hypothetical protein|nr:hypothetical protein [Verrucomicrobiae bacterium]